MIDALLETELPFFETVLHNAYCAGCFSEEIVLFPKLTGCQIACCKMCSIYWYYYSCVYCDCLFVSLLCSFACFRRIPEISCAFVR